MSFADQIYVWFANSVVNFTCLDFDDFEGLLVAGPRVLNKELDSRVSGKHGICSKKIVSSWFDVGCHCCNDFDCWL